MWFFDDKPAKYFNTLPEPRETEGGSQSKEQDIRYSDPVSDALMAIAAAYVVLLVGVIALVLRSDGLPLFLGN